MARGTCRGARAIRRLKDILLTMKRDRHAYPAAIELEYEVPSGSDAVKETAKCLDFCKAVLAKG